MSQNILPKSSKEFANKEYWDKFFALRNKAFEWYGNYDDLQATLSKYIKRNDELLIVGCGNSSLSADIYDAGYVNNTSIDISKIVIDKITTKYTPKRAGLKFKEMSVFDLKYDDEQFNVVLDKGTLDALASDTQDDVGKMFDEIDRVLKPLGRYVCISLLQETVLKILLERFITRDQRWLVRIHRIPISTSESLKSQNPSMKQKETFQQTDLIDFPVFAVIFTKLKSPMAISLPVDIYLDSDKNPTTRCKEVENVIESIDSLQKLEFLRYYIRNSSSDSVISENDDFCSELFGNGDNTNWRYALFFAKRPSLKKPKCAVFIVTQGREHEWLFSTAKGREALRQQSGFDRLIVVHLSRKHHFESIDQIKAELSSEVSGFFPKIIHNDRIDFLSLGDDVGSRVILHKYYSKLSGDLVVEDVQNNEDEDKSWLYRRLVFLSNRNIIQSEARLNKENKKIDYDYLACEHHEIISASLSICEPILNRPKKLLLIGLGGGGLISFLSKHLNSSKLEMTVVEIDPIICKIAKDWFGFKDSMAKIVVGDGLEFIRNANDGEFDFIIFDVDSKDSTLGISCPPVEFVDENFLKIVHSKLSSDGVFILNLVARNIDMKKDIHSRLKELFGVILSINIDCELNEIILSFKELELKYCKIRDEHQRLKYLRNNNLFIEILEKTYKQISQKRSIIS